MINRYSQVYTVQVEFSKYFVKNYFSKSILIFILLPIVSLIAIILIIIFVLKKSRKSEEKTQTKKDSDQNEEKNNNEDNYGYQGLSFETENKEMVTISQIGLQETNQSIARTE